MSGIYVCANSDMHPYECSPLNEGDAPCIHCEGTKTETHDPETCLLCIDP